MTIKWIAHACFYITLESGKTLLFDPFSGIGYEMPELTADMVFVSHSHYDHSAVDKVKGDFTVYDKPGVYEQDDVKIEGFLTYHDDVMGEARGENIIFKIKTEGVTLAHFGDLGHIPSEEIIAQLQDVDVIFVPVGGNYTIDAKQAFALCKMLNPNMIIPMHYKTPGLTVDVATIHPFIEAISGYYDRSMQGKSEITFNKDDRKKRTRVMILENSMNIIE